MLKSFLSALLLIIPIVNGCKIDQDKKVERSKFHFTIGDDSELFFRNVRQIYYDRSSPDGTWQAYRFSDRDTTNDRPIIVPVIVINWLKDEAYLLIDTNDILNEEDYLQIVISETNSAKTDTVTLHQRGRERMLEFGSRLYEAIIANQKMTILSNGAFLPLLQETIDREAFRITIADYYRLTRVF
jgi:hypothetical protein